MPRAVVRARIAFASGVAGSAVATLMLAGRAPGAVTTALALVVAAQAAATISSARPEAARAFGRLTSSVPAWVGIVLVAATRAGSGDLADIRGAHAVLGIALTHGSAMMVAACVLAAAAGTMVLAWTWTPLEQQPMRLAVLAGVLQVGLLVTLFSGPQVRTATDAVPWGIAVVSIAAAVWLLRRFARWEWLGRAATLTAAVALGAAVVGGRA